MPEPGNTTAAMPPAGSSLEAVRRALTRTFAARELASPALDARLLLMAACGVMQTDLIRAGDRPLSGLERAWLVELVERRLGGEPVSRILGQRGFWGLDFRLSAETLDPRADTETLVEAVLAALPAPAPDAEPLRFLDLGTGSGCVLIALLRELPHAIGVGTDISLSALSTARDNARRNGVAERARFVRADWLSGIRGPFGAIAVNPPYIARNEVAGLAPDVRDHDPHAALDGGADGLDAYRAILGGLVPVMRPGGIAAFEVGRGQADSVAAMMAEAGLAPASPEGAVSVRDLAGVERVVVMQRPDVDRMAKKELESGAIHDSLV